MQFKLYNTASRQVEIFEPHQPPQVNMYTCGLTVYDYCHIGNIRAYIASDVLRRALELRSYQVNHVMNITDVGHMTSDEDAGEDKLEVKSRKEGKSPWEIARYYEEYFLATLEKMNIQPCHTLCHATEHIDDMIELVKRLEEQGYTYNTSVGVIFDTSQYPQYADFARLNLDAQIAGSRVEIDPERKKAWDFALWVTNQPKHIMQWDSPWGRGFPGWHIECSAMSMKYLGEQLDIHTGGVDHLAVHHTNEIAQSEAATGKTFVKYWMHSEFLTIDGTKMSKSIGNLFTLEDLVKRGVYPLSLRYLFLNSSYRKQMNFTWEALKAAQTALMRLYQRVQELPEEPGEPLEHYIETFDNAIATDLNTPRGLAVLWEVINCSAPQNHIKATVAIMDRVLGLGLDDAGGRLTELKSIAEEALGEVTYRARDQAEQLAQQRQELRSARKFTEADAVRDQILQLGYTIEDTPDGYRLIPKVTKS
ncbi:MAG: cysteine--tRNA ligase [Deltaproteobacteria bacterium]|nr:cysteine--tRNA ligase [Deltaproteobacteria bacterium]